MLGCYYQALFYDLLRHRKEKLLSRSKQTPASKAIAQQQRREDEELDNEALSLIASIRHHFNACNEGTKLSEFLLHEDVVALLSTNSSKPPSALSLIRGSKSKTSQSNGNNNNNNPNDDTIIDSSNESHSCNRSSTHMVSNVNSSSIELE